ncbi:twin-arginine translocation signal domain-containing protein [Halocatena marina]|uniref:Twin-arginine translocation signal domain-containing protein n=1 Tax=Halocatena marina TaxID=2934937 RepID=A0ABD5YX17_9EURY
MISMSKKEGFSRRGFIKNTAAIGTAGLFATTESACNWGLSVPDRFTRRYSTL